jgi:hypothetical protein
MTELWSTAEAWGFGPASKMLAVTDLLASREPSVRLRFFADGSGRDLIGDLHECAGRDELIELLKSPGARDGILFNVMDADMQLTAAANGVPCVYLDSLVHLWALMEEYGLAYYDRLAESVLRTGADLAPTLELVNPYDKHWLAHLVSDASLYQALTPFEGFRRELIQHVGANRCGLVVDGRLGRRGQPGKRTVLVSLGGRPRDPLDVERAVHEVRRALRGVAEEYRLVVCAARSSLARLLPAQVELACDRYGYLQAFSECDLVVAAPGLTTMCEALATRCPCIVLPPTIAGGWYFSERRHAELVDSWQESAGSTQLAFAQSEAELRTLIGRALTALPEPAVGSNGPPWEEKRAGVESNGVEIGTEACVEAILTVLERARYRTTEPNAAATTERPR